MLNKKFQCRCVDSEGNITERIKIGNNKITITQELLKMELRVISIKQIYKNSINSGKNLKLSELILFTNTLYLLCNSKLSISQAVGISTTIFKSKKLIRLSLNIQSDIQKGDSFSCSLKRVIPNLPPLYLGLIKVGEKSGNINVVLSYLNSYLIKEKEYKDKISSSLIYPVMVLVITLILSVLFSIFIIPKFNSMFSTLGGINSQIIYKSRVMVSIIQFISASFVVVSILSKTNTVKIDKLKLKTPIFGKYLRCHYTYLLLFSISILIKSGFTIELGLKHSIEIIQNRYLKKALANIQTKIIKGVPLSTAFINSPFEGRVESFIKIGEECGSLTSSLEELSKYYESENSKIIEGFIKLIDPVITLTVGGILITIILIFILPVLTKMGELLQ